MQSSGLPLVETPDVLIVGRVSLVRRLLWPSPILTWTLRSLSGDTTSARRRPAPTAVSLIAAGLLRRAALETARTVHSEAQLVLCLGVRGGRTLPRGWVSRFAGWA